MKTSPCILNSYLAFCTDTIFSLDPGKFHKALDQFESSLSLVVEIHETLGIQMPDEILGANNLMLIAKVTKLECQVLGILGELADKPIKLKRAYNNIWDQTPENVWLKTHSTITQLVEKYASKAAAAKKAKVG